MTISPQDIAACIVAVILMAGLIVLAVLDKEIPPEMGIASGSAITWLFVRSAQVAEKQANGHTP